MQTNPVKERLVGGGVAFGTFVFEFSTTGIARIAAEAGAEFVIFDMEHTGWSVETIRMLIATSRGTSAAPLVRVPATEYHFLARVLDMGAAGVMVPMVESAEQARTIVNSCKYPPVGRRGAAFSIAHDDYRGGAVAEKIERANAGTLLIAQIETAAGLDQVEAIAAVDGIDVLWIGQYDLSSSLGIPGRFDEPEFAVAIARVVGAARQHGKVAGFMPLSVEESRQRLTEGFRCLAFGGDLWIYQQALRSGLNAVKQLANASRPANSD